MGLLMTHIITIAQVYAKENERNKSLCMMGNRHSM